MFLYIIIIKSIIVVNVGSLALAEICFLGYRIVTVQFWDECGPLGSRLTPFFVTAVSREAVSPSLAAPKRAKQLSMATIPLCFEFFRCRAECLAELTFTYYDQHCSIVLAEVNMSTFHFCWSGLLVIDPTFFSIFVCGPLQSFVVHVCTWK